MSTTTQRSIRERARLCTSTITKTTPASLTTTSTEPSWQNTTAELAY